MQTYSRRQLIAAAAGIAGTAKQAAAVALNLPPKFRADRTLDSFSPAANQRYVLADLEGPGCIRHIWTATNRAQLMSNRRMILRIYWDDEERPSVEAPLGDFFGVCHGLFYYPHEFFVPVHPGTYRLQLLFPDAFRQEGADRDRDG